MCGSKPILLSSSRLDTNSYDYDHNIIGVASVKGVVYDLEERKELEYAWGLDIATNIEIEALAIL